MYRNRQNRKTLVTSLAMMAMVLAFLAQTAPLWAAKVDGIPLLICTALGYETIVIDEDGNKVPSPIPTDTKRHCVMCFVASVIFIALLALLFTDVPPVIRTRKIRWQSERALALAHALLITRAIRAPPYYS